jgi:hypothetical protein
MQDFGLPKVIAEHGYRTWLPNKIAKHRRPAFSASVAKNLNLFSHEITFCAVIAREVWLLRT